LGLALFPSIESRLITSKALTFLDSKIPRLGPELDPFRDIQIVNGSQPIGLYFNSGTGKSEGATAVAASNSNITVNPVLARSTGTTENFVRIGHSLLAIVAALLGGQLSSYFRTKNPQGTSAPVPLPVSISND
jgi:hypothetical protein